jgi:hypothetical protein
MTGGDHKTSAGFNQVVNTQYNSLHVSQFADEGLFHHEESISSNN